MKGSKPATILPVSLVHSPFDTMTTLALVHRLIYYNIPHRSLSALMLNVVICVVSAINLLARSLLKKLMYNLDLRPSWLNSFFQLILTY